MDTARRAGDPSVGAPARLRATRCAHALAQAGLDLRVRGMKGAHSLMAQVHPSRQTEDRRFIDLFTRLKPHGGMVSDDELRCLHTVSRRGQSLGMLLLQRELVALKWRHRLWLPLFQFQLPAWLPSQPVAAIVHELHPVLQGFELVEWFITPNPWLHERIPLDLIEREPAHVQRAAQADRFLITF